MLTPWDTTRVKIVVSYENCPIPNAGRIHLWPPDISDTSLSKTKAEKANW